MAQVEGVKARPREDNDQIGREEFNRLLEVYDNSFRNIAEGEVVKGTVLKVTASEVVVDVGYKSEGIIAISELPVISFTTGRCTLQTSSLPP